MIIESKKDNNCLQDSSPFLFCCDWGSSTLRIYLVNTSSQEILYEVCTENGIAKMHDKWQASPVRQVNRVSFYLSYIKSCIDEHPELKKQEYRLAPIIISGMASSNIGIMELPYCAIPFDATGRDALVCKLNHDVFLEREVCIISGVKQSWEVMRGEETQLAGIYPELEKRGLLKRSLLLFPGTHSKHIYLNDGQISKMKTYITGELFSILSENGLLKNVVENNIGTASEADFSTAFLHGFEQRKESLIHSLFKLRSNYVLGRYDKRQNSFYLSGLLIGHEVQDIEVNDVPIVLCCGTRLFNFYELALRSIIKQPYFHFIAPEKMESASYKGQINILKQKGYLA